MTEFFGFGKKEAAPKPEPKFFPLTPYMLNKIPDGTVLRGVSGETLVKGRDRINTTDLRSGFLGVGFFEGEIPEGIEIIDGPAEDIKRADVKIKE